MPGQIPGADLPVPTHAPIPGEQTDALLGEVLRYDAAKVEAVKQCGALG